MMSDFKAFYFNLDQNNQSFVGKLLNQYEKIEWEQVDELNETERGSGGYSSTGVK